MSGETRPTPLMSVRQLAELLGWKLTRTYEADRSGAIPGRVVINGRIWYRRRVVDAWLAGDDVSATPSADQAHARHARATEGYSAARGGR